MSDTMTPLNYNADTILTQFTQKCQEHMLANGFICDKKLIFDESIIRFTIDNKPDEDEWCQGGVYHLPSGEMIIWFKYGSWSTGAKFYLTSSSIDEQEIDADKARDIKQSIQSAQEKKRQDTILKQDAVERLLLRLYRGSKSKSPEMHILPHHKDHDHYIRTKGIKPYENEFWPIKYYKYCGIPSLVIPLINIENKLRSVEYIYYEDGKCIKKFHKEGEKWGNFYIIGDVREFNPLIDRFKKPIPELKQLYIVEGYATGCSLYDALFSVNPRQDFCVVVAFDSGNLVPVVGNLRKIFNEQEFIMCADNDEAGQKHGSKACSQYNCKNMIIKEL